MDMSVVKVKAAAAGKSAVEAGKSAGKAVCNALKSATWSAKAMIFLPIVPMALMLMATLGGSMGWAFFWGVLSICATIEACMLVAVSVITSKDGDVVVGEIRNTVGLTK